MSYLFQKKKLLFSFYLLATQACSLTSAAESKMSLTKLMSAMATI